MQVMHVHSVAVGTALSGRPPHSIQFKGRQSWMTDPTLRSPLGGVHCGQQTCMQQFQLGNFVEHSAASHGVQHAARRKANSESNAGEGGDGKIGRLFQAPEASAPGRATDGRWPSTGR